MLLKRLIFQIFYIFNKTNVWMVTIKRHYFSVIFVDKVDNFVEKGRHQIESAPLLWKTFPAFHVFNTCFLVSLCIMYKWAFFGFFTGLIRMNKADPFGSALPAFYFVF